MILSLLVQLLSLKKVSCKMPHIFSLFISKSLGGLIFILFLVNFCIDFLIISQFLKVMFLIDCSFGPWKTYELKSG